MNFLYYLLQIYLYNQKIIRENKVLWIIIKKISYQTFIRNVRFFNIGEVTQSTGKNDTQRFFVVSVKTVSRKHFYLEVLHSSGKRLLNKGRLVIIHPLLCSMYGSHCADDSIIPGI